MNGDENGVNSRFIGVHGGFMGGSWVSGPRIPCASGGLTDLFTHSFPSHRDTPPLLRLLAGAWSHSSGLHRTQQSRPGQSANAG
jgi:hypothetical protein